MSLTDGEIIQRLSESPVMSEQFETAATEYLRRMNEDGDVGIEHMALGFGVAEALASRFNGSSDELLELTRRLGPCRIFDLFWFSLEDMMSGEENIAFPVPEKVIEYLRTSLRSCPEVYGHARARALNIMSDLAFFHRFFAVGHRQRTVDEQLTHETRIPQ